VRTFTRNGTRLADEEEIQSLKNESELSAASGAELDDKTILGFPTLDKLATTRGKKEGEIRIFREGMKAKAYAWQKGKWELMGDVQGQQHAKKKYEGDKYFPAGEYDYVFDVQDESGIHRRLPFNDGDNALTSAEKFLVREGMSLGYKEQIIQFIMKNSRSKGKIGTAPAKPKTVKKKLTPIRERKFYRKMNLEGLQGKLIEFNAALQAEKHPQAVLEG
jgi:phospholipase A-2-activating protein